MIQEIVMWNAMETAPRDGTSILCIDADGNAHVCYPKRFPRPLAEIADVGNFESRAGDTWEYFRDEQVAPGHSWSMVPVAWMPIPEFDGAAK